jgi:menaquinone-dependent protoporphyrinogen IX oxidase
MPDLTITRSGELTTVAGVDGETAAGVEFVDAWFPTRPGAQCTVVDSGRLVIEADDVDAVVAGASAKGLEVEVVAGV